MVERAQAIRRHFLSPGIARGLRAFGILLLVSCAIALLVVPAVAGSPAVLQNAEQRSVVSKAGGEYRIFVVRPKAPPPPEGYPVLYVLDGNSVVGMLSSLQQSHMGRSDLSGFDPGLVVAIGYPTDQPLDMKRRSMDYTPAQAAQSGTFLKAEETGGADRFLDFIEQELKPALEKEFRIDRSRQALFGHSFGGLFALHVLFTRPQAFQTYVAASPSVWWADRAILQTEKKFAAAGTRLDGKRLLLTVGGYEQALDPSLAKAKDAAEIAGRLKQRRQVDEARGLSQRLAALKERGLNVSFEEIAGETHGSVIPFALIKGFRFAFAPKHGG